MLGRNNARRSVLMVPTSSRAKSNNIVAGNKLNSIFGKSYAVRHEEQIEISAVGKTAKFTFSKPRSVINSKINWKDYKFTFSKPRSVINSKINWKDYWKIRKYHKLNNWY